MTTGTPQQPKPGGAVATTSPVRDMPIVPALDGVWNPFSLMDRLDADALVEEMQGIASDVLVYRIKEAGKKEDTVGLSKSGVDECCTMLVQQGQAIRELSVEHEFIGEGEQREALFKCVAARFAVHGDGREVRMDQVIGVKREPLFEDRAPLTLDARVPGKRWADKGAGGQPLTYREALDLSHPAQGDREDAKGYLQWIVDVSSFDDMTKQFVAAILQGIDVKDFAAGKRFNPFWYEHGAMKAARNARFRLIPAGVKAAVIALAKQTNRERAVEQPRATAHADVRTEDHRPRFTRRDPKRAAYGWLFAPTVGIPVDAMTSPGKYLLSDNELQKAARWADKGLAGEEVKKGDGPKSILDEDEIKTVRAMKAEIEHELQARMEYMDELRVSAGSGNEDATAAADARND